MIPCGPALLAANNASGPTPQALLHFDGTNGSTTFTDETGRVWAAAGTAQLDTSVKKFGTASGKFDGSGNHISSTDSAAFNTGSGPWTYEMWVRPTSTGPGRAVFSRRITAVYCPLEIVCLGGATGQIQILISNATFNGWALIQTFDTALIDINVWTSIAITCDTVNIMVFAGGIKSLTGCSAVPIPSAAQNAYIGQGGDAAFIGHIDEFRFTNACLYNANYTPATGPFPNP